MKKRCGYCDAEFEGKGKRRHCSFECAEKKRLRTAKSFRERMTGEQKIEESYKRKKYVASKKGIPFSLTPEEFRSLWKKPCHYCNDIHKNNGIDRKDADGAYMMNNCVPCCPVCNTMKSIIGYDTFITKCFAIVEQFKSQNETPSDYRGAFLSERREEK